MESGMLADDFDERISSINGEEDVVLRENIKAWTIKIRDANRPCRWSISTLLQKKGA